MVQWSDQVLTKNKGSTGLVVMVCLTAVLLTWPVNSQESRGGVQTSRCPSSSPSSLQHHPHPVVPLHEDGTFPVLPAHQMWLVPQTPLPWGVDRDGSRHRMARSPAGDLGHQLQSWDGNPGSLAPSPMLLPVALTAFVTWSINIYQKFQWSHQQRILRNLRNPH